MSKIKCKICGRKLTSSKSKMIGIGPVCFKKTINKIKKITLLDFVK